MTNRLREEFKGKKLSELSSEQIRQIIKDSDHPAPSNEPTLANTAGGIIFLPGIEADGWFDTSGIPGTAEEWAESVLIACGIKKPDSE